MRPMGRSNALMRAGAIGDRGSTAIATFGVHGLLSRTRNVLSGAEVCRGVKLHSNSGSEAVTLRRHQGEGGHR